MQASLSSMLNALLTTGPFLTHKPVAQLDEHKGCYAGCDAGCDAGCYAEGREFYSGRTITQGLKITD